MKICVFCSANSNIEPVYFEKTRELGEWCAKNGHSIVFGGCDMGLMECVAEAAYSNGGMTIGVVPSKIEENGHVSPHLSVEIPCDNLSDRKDLLLLKSDIVIALPGGIGTLDEVIGTLTLAKLDKYDGKIFALNLDGFYNPLKDLLDHYVRTGMLDARSRGLIEFPDTVSELVGHLD